jgi:release factor glutamine methyltransferase
VVSNPPYVPTGADVAAEVRADPAEAVFAGTAGLDLLPSVVVRAALLLRPSGIFAVEHDESHAQTVLDMIDASGDFTDVVGHADLSGRPRYATARRFRAYS